MPSKAAAHTYLAEKLSFPPYYGRNLDALYDVLAADVEFPTCLVIYQKEKLVETLGTYGELLLEVMKDAARESPYLRVILDGSDE